MITINRQKLDFLEAAPPPHLICVPCELNFPEGEGPCCPVCGAEPITWDQLIDFTSERKIQVLSATGIMGDWEFFQWEK
jgi:hypothetical protein